MGNAKNNLVVYSEGEDLLAADLMNMQLFERAFQLDILGGPDYRKRGVETYLDTAYGFTKGAGPYPYGTGSGGLFVHTAPGLLIQRVNNTIDGLTPATLVYYADTDEFGPIAVTPDPTNPRYVGIFYKLSLDDTLAGSSETRDFEDAITRANTSTTTNKKRRVRCDVSVVHGTPSAGTTINPAFPATPAGYVPWGYALIRGGETDVQQQLVMNALVPCGYRTIFLHPGMIALPTNWTRDPLGALTAAASPGDLVAHIPVGQTERIMFVEVHRVLGGALVPENVEIRQLALNAASTANTACFSFTDQRGFGGVVGRDFYCQTPQNPALWGDGSVNGGANIQNGLPRTSALIRYQASQAGDVVKGFTIHVCGR